jgi:hypothetical protein
MTPATAIDASLDKGKTRLPLRRRWKGLPALAPQFGLRSKARVRDEDRILSPPL